MIMIANKKKILLGQLLLEKNIITREQLEMALAKQKEMGELLGKVLLELGFIDQENEVLPFVAQQYGVEYVNLKNQNIPEEAIERVPVKIAKRYNVIPVESYNGTVRLAMNKPYDVLLCDELKILLQSNIYPVLAGQKDIIDAIRKYYGVGAETIEKIMIQTDLSDRKIEEVTDLEKIDSEATIGNFLNQIFLEAYKDRATDIHIEPFEKELIIRYRIDGLLYDIHVSENIKYFKDSINSRIKIMSNLDITERRIPQDGRFHMRVGNVELDLRVSFLPTPYGESVVIRILNSSKLFGFDELDLAPEEKNILEGLIRKPHGIAFITGPTGSGKTTTLYSCLSLINTVEKKIITIEDPVEYQLRSITQIQINPGIHMTFARGLRSILRHDPNVIMVGEVRDVETAEIAIQAALTGHLIFSTLHTNDAASGVTRLLNMGIESYLITSTVECFIAQRLVRVICPKCKTPRRLNPKMISDFKVNFEDDSEITIYEGRGCEHCNSTGYCGRTGIFEFLVLNDEISDLILTRASASQIKEKAVQCGMKSLRQSGWEKVKMGITTPEEVMRVTQERSRRK